ncbi:hypothetical protein BES34_020345 [Leptospira inadai serovar Lyme]|uniref:Uncharacterized protein n=1 Tax=Leptospira inadai serovar Lyme TaxID=293084 RepID=A0ABX4YD75_9LEPT|nr:hypothetical protein BES34_020345 [Leptospira inadai serovar Lyme]
METRLINVLSSVLCLLSSERQKLLDVGKAAEVGERSNITQESSPRAWKPGSSMFCPQSSVFCPLKDRNC